MRVQTRHPVGDAGRGPGRAYNHTRDGEMRGFYDSLRTYAVCGRELPSYGPGPSGPKNPPNPGRPPGPTGPDKNPPFPPNPPQPQ